MVSVIVPVFNRAETIPDSVRSVLEQTYSELELIVVDDCSSDNTGEVVKAFADPRIRYIRSDKNQGACAARNIGIENARGKYAAFQDSDDIWESDKLEKQLSLMESLNADICFCRLHRHGFPAYMEEYFPDLESGLIPYEQLLKESLVSTQTIVAKREIVEKFKFDPKLRRMQDYDWIIRAGEHSRVAFAGDAAADTRRREDSITASGAETLEAAYEYFFKKYADKFEEHPDFYISLLERAAFNRLKLGEDASAEYRAVYEAEKTFRNRLRWFCAERGILKYLWKRKISRYT